MRAALRRSRYAIALGMREAGDRRAGGNWREVTGDT
jgi:hypothetical protein